jgi:hypothetical protein
MIILTNCKNNAAVISTFKKNLADFYSFAVCVIRNFLKVWSFCMVTVTVLVGHLSINLFCSTHTPEYLACQKSQMSVCFQLYTKTTLLCSIYNKCLVTGLGERNCTQCPPTSNFNFILLILRIKLLGNSLRNHLEIPNNTKNQNSEQKAIRIHNERSQQQKSNDNSENFLVKLCFYICV